MERLMTSEEVFILWKHEVKEIGKARYTAEERREQLDLLSEMFYEKGIEFEEAKSYSRRVVEFMVTKEGQKDNGRYKGWKKNTEEDFLSNLLAYYQGQFKAVNDTTHINKKTKKLEYYGAKGYLDRTPIIVAWTKHKFKKRWSEAICLETHKVGTPLWQLFKQEVFDSKWAKTGERPDWAKNVF